MANITREECETRVNGLHAKLDKILANQAAHGERLATVEARIGGWGGTIGHVVTGAVAFFAAWFASKLGRG